MDGRRTSILGGLLVVAVLAALTTPARHAVADGRSRTTGAGRPATGADVQVALASGRGYVEHQPAAGTAAASRSRPLVVALPGLWNTPAVLAASSRLDAFADAHGFLLAYGVGVGRSWNAGRCCGEAAAGGIDDVAYLADVVADVAGRHLVDRRRVYVVGFSNGGMLAERAVCDRPDLFAAAGSVAGPLLVPCLSPVPVRIAHLHGLRDTTVPYLGGFSQLAGVWMPSSAALPASVARQVPGSTVELVTVAGMGHRWPSPRRDGIDGTATLWAFLSAWSRRGCGGQTSARAAREGATAAMPRPCRMRRLTSSTRPTASTTPSSPRCM